uniref:Uncharacterized protein n=1 Tax=Oryza brachyantha TaxID=4533 RepID=J3L3N4_ORYBR
ELWRVGGLSRIAWLSCWSLLNCDFKTKLLNFNVEGYLTMLLEMLLRAYLVMLK